ncbi:hypothetical protein [Rhodobacter sp. 24-YEA-8]|uniref:hypothetical protein n=1 Tax=Rhodobacter sp. 24-YEA-8 TaxID=1884310 RepID=UPI00089657C7|nr:hypothetical protein [Rhodobacter sp. 24-YEA-8]SEB79197.1 hypothetical protein SAMN05519105_1318 [Rhodobacter sp. 24-YEA-8]
MHGITDNLEIRVVGAPVANGSGINNASAIIDMAGYESVAFVATITDSAATGVATLAIQSSDTDGAAGMEAVEDTTATVTSAADDDLNSRALLSEIRKPGKRFVRAVRTSATANIAYGSVIAILTPHRRPAEKGATVAGAAFVSG